MVDPTGGWGDPLPRNLPGRLYTSKDAAAWAWAKLYVKFSLDNNVELSSVIYEYQYKGITYFGFTQATWAPDPSLRYRSSPGPEHFMKEYKATNKEWDRSHLVPNGAKIVGHIHSHGGENSNSANINPSEDDKDIMSKHDHLTYYLLNYKGRLKKFDPDENVALWGKSMVVNMYCGKQCREKVDNNGAGSKTGIFDPNSKSDNPIENILLIGNSKKSQVINDNQALNSNIIPGLLKIASTALAVYSTASVIANVSSIPKGLACPVF